MEGRMGSGAGSNRSCRPVTWLRMMRSAGSVDGSGIDATGVERFTHLGVVAGSTDDLSVPAELGCEACLVFGLELFEHAGQ